jgi:ubiquinone/menaquinone biosynthesis C-methylase UbiE
MTSFEVPILHQLFSTRLIHEFGREQQALPEIHVLDLGCGLGEQMVYMSRLGFQMSGCEVNANLVNSTLAALNRAGFANTDVRLSTVPTELPFEANRFHAVYANGVFEHCSEMPSLVAEVSRVLMPNGVFLTAFPLQSVIMETHVRLPFVHWFAKGRMQRSLIRTMSHLLPHEERNWPRIERYLQNDVFYWTRVQVQQILNRHFEETKSLAKEYLLMAKNQMNSKPILRLALAATAVPIFVSILARLVSWQWTYVVEASKPKHDRSNSAVQHEDCVSPSLLASRF